MTIYSNSILCGDASAILTDLQNRCVDLVVTDPPYLVNYRDRTGRRIVNDDNPDAVLSVYGELFRVLKPNSVCVSFCSWTAIDQFSAAWTQAGFKTVGRVVWVKPYASSARLTRYRHETAYVLAKGRPKAPRIPLDDVQEWVYTGNTAHPTQKAVEIVEPLIQAFSQPGDLVLDPFLGSGTTAVAAALNNRDYIGVEWEPQYCAIARQRLAGVEGATTKHAA